MIFLRDDGSCFIILRDMQRIKIMDILNTRQDCQFMQRDVTNIPCWNYWTWPHGLWHIPSCIREQRDHVFEPTKGTSLRVHIFTVFVLPFVGVAQYRSTTSTRVQLKCHGTRWRTGGEVKGKLANGMGSQYSSHDLGTWCIQHYYRWCAHLGCQ